MEIITPTQIDQIIPGLQTEARCKELAMLVNSICLPYGINTPLRLAAFLAQVMHESNYLAAKEENLNYSAARLRALFPKYFKSEQEAKPYERKPQMIANRIYGGRMGNVKPNDGYLFRGSGFIQLTGRENNFKYALYKKIPVEACVEQIRTDDKAAMDSAAWFFSIFKPGLVAKADIGKIDEISEAINGGKIGIEERRALYVKIKSVLKIN